MKMKSLFLGFCIGVLLVSTGSHAQNQDQVLFTIDGEPVYVSEFTRILNKNIQGSTQSDIKESFDLFVNFKLKVKEAEALGYDTTKQFKSELKLNRDQIAKPYLLDQNVNDQLLEEAYQRSLEEVRSSHILVGLTRDAPPADTLRAYQKAMKIKHRLLGGEDFSTVAKEVSEDPSAQSNGGDLGYYTVFQLVYPFENAIYSTPIGEISDPIRTQFGYHIVKVTDRRKTRGQLQVAIILKAFNYAMTDEERAEVKTEIYRIDSLLKAGTEFSDLAKKYSDDRNTGNQGGVMRWFGVGSFPFEFENAAFNLKEIGEVSQPVETQMGWYLIKLLGKKDNPPKEEVLPTLARTISRKPRAAKSRSEIARKLKVEYSYSLNKENFEEFYRLVDPSIFDARWDPIMALQKTGILFTLGDMKVLQRDFARYLSINMKQITATTIAEFVDQEFAKFEEAKILEYEDSQLEKKYPEFKALYQEFREGNLLFEIMDKQVWSKAAEDSAGLARFYEENKTNYMWEERAEGYIIRMKSMTDAERFAGAVRDRISKGGKDIFSKSDLEEILKEEQDTVAGDTYEVLAGPFEHGSNRIIDGMKWKKGEIQTSVEGSTTIISWIKQIKKPEPKLLAEAKGQVLASYQENLEKQWVNDLKEKYSVVINNEALESIK